MAYQLSNVITDVLQRLHKLSPKTATGGSTTSAVVASIINNDDDDAFNGGTLFVLRTTDGNAPQYEYQPITDYVQSTGTFTTGTFTAAIGAGDIVGYIGADEFPILDVIGQVNIALQGLGDVPLVDTSTLTTADGQTEYTAPVAWKRNPPFRIDIQVNNDTDDNQWSQLFAWEYVPSAPGSTGLIIFREQIPAGYKLRVWYEDRHPEVTIYSSPIAEFLKPDTVQKAVLDQILSWINVGQSGQDEYKLQFRNEIMQSVQEAKANANTWKPTRKNKIVVY